MGAYLIVEITVHDTQRFAEYAAEVPPHVARHGGVYRVRGGAVATCEGDWAPQRMVVIEFPDTAAARAFLADPEYQPVAALRHAAATSQIVIVEGV